MPWRILAAAVGLLVATSLSFAHHGGAVEWQSDILGPVTGTATKFAFTFPHVVVYIEMDEGATPMALTTRWTPTIMRRGGWTRNSIEPGDSVTVTYRAHVTDPSVVQMQTIEVNGEELPLQF